MLGQTDAPRDSAVQFLPHRLNRQPVVVRGLTADELWISVGIASVCGLVLGIPLAWIAHSVAVAPTVIMICVAAGVFIGGGVLRRKKRGRPETWLYRQMQWWLCGHLPALSVHLGGSDLIRRSGYWSTRRGTS